MRSDAGSGQLHNMSAPPRTTVAFRPVAARSRAPAETSTESPTAAGAGENGLRWLLRIDLINHFWPVEPGLGRDPAEGVFWPQTREPERRTLARAWTLERGLPADDPATAGRVSALLAELVSDELREVARRQDPSAWNLPAMALLTPASAGRQRPASHDVLLAITVLARTRGSVFLRAAEPLSVTVGRMPVDVWAVGPQAASRRAATP
jgi:hypothetical protein